MTEKKWDSITEMILGFCECKPHLICSEASLKRLEGCGDASTLLNKLIECYQLLNLIFLLEIGCEEDVWLALFIPFSESLSRFLPDDSNRRKARKLRKIEEGVSCVDANLSCRDWMLALWHWNISNLSWCSSFTTKSPFLWSFHSLRPLFFLYVRPSVHSFSSHPPFL